MTTAEKIKAIRKSLKLTQAEFAENLRVGSSYISGIEKGKKHPSSTLISFLKVVYSVNPVWWETGEGFMFTKGPLGNVPFILNVKDLPPDAILSPVPRGIPTEAFIARLPHDLSPLQIEWIETGMKMGDLEMLEWLVEIKKKQSPQQQGR